MNPQEMQGQNQDLTPEEAKALLGFSTHVNEQFLMHQTQAQQPPQPQDTPASPQDALETTPTPNGQEGPVKEIEALKTQLSTLEQKMQEMSQGAEEKIKEEMSSLRKDIQDALAE